MALMIPGFVHLADVFAKRVEEVGIAVVSDAVNQFFEEHNRQMDAFNSLFVTKTTEYKTMYRSVFTTRNQPLDANGRALPVKGYDRYEIMLPLQMSGQAWGINWLTAKKSTVEEIAQDTQAIGFGDLQWNFDLLMASLYTNTSGGWDWNDDKHGALKVQGLANGDSTVYKLFSGASAGATDDHYLFQAAAMDDANDPFDEIYEELAEHPENGTNTDVVVFVPTNLKASIRALTAFHPLADPNVAIGANSDKLVGSLGVNVPGTVIGYHDSGCWIVEWKRQTSSYMIAVATGGNRPIAMREDELDSLKGFIQIPGPGGYTREDYPFYEQQWARMAGYGGWNRVGALVYRVGSGSYAIPTGYQAPIR